MLWNRLSKQSLWPIILAIGLASSFWPSIEFGPEQARSQLSFGLVVFLVMAAFCGLSLITNKKSKYLAATTLLAGFYLIYNLNLGQLTQRSWLLGAVYLAVVLVILQPKIRLKNRKLLLRAVNLMIIASVAFGALQVVADSLGYNLLLRPEYTGEVFGFARAQALFEEPQFLAGFILIGLFYSLAVRPVYWKQLLAVSVFGLALTMSRGAILAAGLAGLPFLPTRPELVKKVIVWAGLGFVFGLILIGFAGYARSDFRISPVKFQQNYLRHLTGQSIADLSQKPASVAPVFAQTADISSHAGRPVAWQDGLDLFSGFSPTQKLFGNGFDAYNRHMQAEQGSLSNGRGYTTNNFYIQTLLDTGLLGLSLLIGCLAYVFFGLNSLNSRLALFLKFYLLAAFVQLMFNGSIVNNLHIWLLLGLGFSLVSNEKPDRAAFLSKNRR